MHAIFKKAYRKLAEEGQCDGYGGAECKRVYDEWLYVGKPDNLEEFIIKRANALDDKLLKKMRAKDQKAKENDAKIKAKNISSLLGQPFSITNRYGRIKHEGFRIVSKDKNYSSRILTIEKLLARLQFVEDMVGYSKKPNR